MALMVLTMIYVLLINKSHKITVLPAVEVLEERELVHYSLSFWL